MGIDSFYTPVNLAAQLVSHITRLQLDNVADFCMGDGELLRNAEKRWPNTEIFGVDISRSAVSYVKSKHSEWRLQCGDFLKMRIRKRFDLILLNPPFSCKSSEFHSVKIGRHFFKASTAMLFLLRSLRCLNHDGILYAILPASIASSQKDQQAWSYLREKWKAKVIAKIDSSTFKGCNPNVILVSINDDNSCQVSEQLSISYYRLVRKVVRGTISPRELAHKETASRFFIHTTNLKEGSTLNINKKTDVEKSLIKGPAVLFPRVGRPNNEKLCAIGSNTQYVLSDCVIGIETFTDGEATELLTWIKSHWDDFVKLYSGTGAKYITVRDVLSVFSTI